MVHRCSDDMSIQMKSMWEYFKAQEVDDKSMDDDKNENEIEPKGEEVQGCSCFEVNSNPTV